MRNIGANGTMKAISVTLDTEFLVRAHVEEQGVEPVFGERKSTGQQMMICKRCDATTKGYMVWKVRMRDLIAARPDVFSLQRVPSAD